MVDKKKLSQYYDLKKEAAETKEKIQNLEIRIEKLQNRICQIENGEIVRDKVRGGMGGIQNFTIEGIPKKEYDEKKTDILVKKLILEQRRCNLVEMEAKIEEMTYEIEKFISSIDDSLVRRIINLRFIEKMTWSQVAEKIGGGNSHESVKKIYQRFMEANTCPQCPEKV